MHVHCLSERKWGHSGSDLPQENKEESDVYGKTNALYPPYAMTYNRSPVVDQVSMTLR